MRAGNRRSSQKLVQLILPERQPRTERDIGSTIPEDESWKLWNFTKFIIDREGNVVARFEPTADMAEVEACVKALL